MILSERVIPATLEAKSELDAGKGKLLNSFPKYIWKMSGQHQLALCFLATLLALLSLIPLELQRRIIDDAIENQSVESLIYFGAAYAGSIFIYQVLKLVFRGYQGWVSESTIKNTRAKLVNIHSDARDKKGQSVSVIVTEVESIGTYIGEHISDASANAMMLISIIAYMFVVEPEIALFAIVFLLPQIALVPYMQRLLNHLIERRVNLVRKLGDNISEVERTQKKIPGIISGIYLNRMRFIVVKYTMKTLINFLNALGPLTVLLYGGYLAIQGETTAGVIVAFLSGFQKLAEPFRGLVTFYRLTAQTGVQYKMLKDWVKRNA